MSSNGAAEQNFELPEPDFDRFVPESGSDGGSSDGGEPQDKPSGALKSRKTHMAARQNQLAARYVDISFGLQIQYYFFCLFLGIIPFFAYGSAFTQIGWGLQLLGYLKSQAYRHCVLPNAGGPFSSDAARPPGCSGANHDSLAAIQRFAGSGDCSWDLDVGRFSAPLSGQCLPMPGVGSVTAALRTP